MSIELAKQHIQQGEFHSAIEVLDSLYPEQPNNAEITYLLACLYIDTKDISQAKDWLDTTLVLQPHFLEAKDLLAGILLAEENYQQALHYYLQIDKEQNNNFVILNAIGKCYEMLAEHKMAQQYYEKAFLHYESSAEFSAAYIQYLQQNQIHDKAASACQQAYKKFPKSVPLLYQYGKILHRNNEIDQALNILHSAYQLDQNHIPLLNLYAVCLYRGEKIEQAKRMFNRVLELDPAHCDALIDFAQLELEQGEVQHAAQLLSQAIQLQSDSQEAHLSYANALTELQQFETAKKHYKKAIKINPKCIAAYNNLSKLYNAQGLAQKAIKCLKKALKIAPEDIMSTANLAALYFDIGFTQEALRFSAKAINAQPDNPIHVNNYLYALNHIKFNDEHAIFEHHCKLSTRLVQLAKLDCTKNINQNPRAEKQKKIRVGYLSGSFHRHSITCFLKPLLEAHNRSQYEIYCYNNHATSETNTLELKRASDNWRDIFALSDEAVFATIQKDNIDILVDLSGHTNNNRLLVFARQAAPIQISWLGYPNTVGIQQMQYRFTDAIADPAGDADALHSETLIRLANGAWCYQADESLELTHETPLVKNGYITFGSFNPFAKLNAEVIATWCSLLKRNKTAKLLLKSHQLVDTMVQEHFIHKFASNGVSADRLQFASHTDNYQAHMALYGEVDIALDAFPYNSATTTFEALWMGVPVLTLAQECHRSRISASILQRLNYAELIANSSKEYVKKATALAKDQNRLNTMRKTLRRRLQASALCDNRRFAQEVEKQYELLHRNQRLPETDA